MPEPTAKANGSWFIKGSTDNEMVKNCKNEALDSFNDENHGGLLLHMMFERFLDDQPDKSEQTALIEYLEGEKVENMKTISYRELNEQANSLARILIRKLGKTNWLENDKNECVSLNAQFMNTYSYFEQAYVEEWKGDWQSNVRVVKSQY